MDKVFCKDCVWYKGYGYCTPEVIENILSSYNPIEGKVIRHQSYYSKEKNKDYNCEYFRAKEERGLMKRLALFWEKLK